MPIRYKALPSSKSSTKQQLRKSVVQVCDNMQIRVQST